MAENLTSSMFTWKSCVWVASLMKLLKTNLTFLLKRKPELPLRSATAGICGLNEIPGISWNCQGFPGSLQIKLKSPSGPLRPGENSSVKDIFVELVTPKMISALITKPGDELKYLVKVWMYRLRSAAVFTHSSQLVSSILTDVCLFLLPVSS